MGEINLPDALRAALADDVENLAVALTEAVLADGLGFKGPFEEFGRIAEPLLLDALGAARRDGAQIANEAARAERDQLAADLHEAREERDVLRTLLRDVANEADIAAALTPDPHQAAGSASRESDHD